jgi:hypothetical protein
MITDLHHFGFAKETELQPRVESALEESVKKNKPRYEQFDYESDNWYIELKSRRAKDKHGRPLLPDSNDTWLLPTSKRPKKADKETVYFYYFEADNSLWYVVYDEETFADIPADVPYWHPTGQEHWYIPKNLWTKIDS